MEQQAAAAAAAAEAAALEAAALTARYDSAIAQLQQLMEQQGGEASLHLAELHARAEQQQQRLAGLAQQLVAVLQLPQHQPQQLQQPGAMALHQTYAATAAGTGSNVGSPLRSSSSIQQQWPTGSPMASGSPSRLAPKQQQHQQQEQQCSLPVEVQELCHTLAAAMGLAPQPEEAAGALQALVSGMTQALLGMGGQAAALEAALAEAQAENEQLLADGAALAGGLPAAG